MSDTPLDKGLAKMRVIRRDASFTLKKSSLLHDEIQVPGVGKVPFQLRPYQQQMVFHLLLMPRFVVGEDTGCGKCTTLDTILPTDRGYRTLGSLAPVGPHMEGEFYALDTPTKVYNGRDWVPIYRYYYGGTKPTRRIRTRRGYEVEGTFAHPLLVRSLDGVEDWKRTKDLVVGDVLCLAREVPPSEGCLHPRIDFQPVTKRKLTYPKALTLSLARLLGYVVAEGNRVGLPPSRHSICVTQFPGEVHDDIRHLFRDVFSWTGNLASKERDRRIQVDSVDIVAYLRACGVEPVLSADKEVPSVVLQAGLPLVREFLRGYFEGEGSVDTRGCIEVSSASRKLLKQVQVLLLGFGILSTRKPKRIKSRAHTYWRLSISGDDARLFAARIGFFSTRKQVLLLTSLPARSNPNLDVVPHARGLVEGLRAAIQEQVTGISVRWGRSFLNTLQHVRRRRRNPTYAFLRNLLEVARQADVLHADSRKAAVHRVCDTHYFYDPIVSIEEGEAEVADIEVDDPSHSFVGNGFVNHNTIEVIGALAHLWEKNPALRVIVVGTKSLASQWEEELRRFFREVNVFVAAGEVEKRRKVREAFLKCDRYPALVYTYGSIARDFTDLQEWSGHLLVADEATVFKEPKTQIHQVMEHLSATASRAWALTATLLKNNLVEGYGIFRVVVPGVFPHSPSTFMKSYCLTQMRLVARGRRVPQIIGYAPDQIDAYRGVIEPFYLGRSKRDVAKDLPKVIPPVEIPVALTPAEWSLYRDAQAGILQVGEKKDDGTTQTKMSALLRCQQVVNHPGLVGVEDVPSSKLSVLVDLLTTGDYAEQQVIVFSRFRTLIVDRIEPALRAARVTVTRVTGGENDAQRAQARTDFQEGRARVILLTSAGGEGINLQAASVIVFYDTPWSAGDYVQIIGRMVRIGSLHERAVTLHLVAKPPGGRTTKTIDDYTLQVLRGKVALFEKVLDRKVFDADDAPAAVDPSLSGESEVDAIFSLLRSAEG